MLRPFSILLRWVLLAAVILASTAPAAAAPPPPAAPAIPAVPVESWAGQLDGLAQWLDAHRKPTECTTRCYVLQSLRLTGSLAEGPLAFELEGAVLAPGPVAVPLFGPPDRVQLSHVTEGGKPAAVGFEPGHYFLYTAARQFVLKGELRVQGELALAIPGPLNELAADLRGGRVVEGAHLSGLSSATIHFDLGSGAAPEAGPTVFQLARAVRVGKSLEFEYRLTLRSGSDLGVVRLPLKYGEKVLDVSGATGWRVDGADLVLPTAGHAAQMTITGTLAQIGRYEDDPRSSYEWWLFESDAEHRLTMTGDARQVDVAESPVPRQQPTSRLFMVQKGQHVDVTSQTLFATEVLAAVVRSHRHVVVLTGRGDLVSDDTFTYENNGIDYLPYRPSGRAIFLASDQRAERIMRTDKGAEELLVPLRTGSHAVHAQALGEAALDRLGGRLVLDAPSYPLTTSSASMTIGLPEHVVPVAVLGGDQAWQAFDGADAAAVVVALLVAGIVFRSARLRILGAVTLGGAWFVWPPLYVLAMGGLVAGALIVLVRRVLRGRWLALAGAGIAGAAGLLTLVLLVAVSLRASAPRSTSAVAPEPMSARDEAPAGGAPKEEEARKDSDTADAKQALGNYRAQNAHGGVLEGVTPVALTLPSYARSVSIGRELVTRDRPFKATVLYVTTWALLPLVGGWLVSVLLLARAHREGLAAAWRRGRVLFERGPNPLPPAPSPAVEGRGEGEGGSP